jgi:photosystem II stability/assembly factor-like uncharacterized protein
MVKFINFFVRVFVICWIFFPAVALCAPVQGVLDRPAVKVLNPAECIMIDVTQAGSRMVAVGERGIIIYSDDSGKTWKQADVPVSVSLTSVCFPSPEKGWAVGHGGVVVHTTDGGKTWSRQLEGITAAKLALETAKAYVARVGTGNEAAQQLLSNVQLLVDDGPDKPFLDLFFKNDQEGFVIGSYGYIFHTRDGGANWTCLMDRADNPDGLNLYSIRASDSSLYISGEQGLFMVSKDNGNSFQRIKTPYLGSFFALDVSPAGEIILVGLRGNAYWSLDQGATFNKSQTPDGAGSFSDIIRLSDDTLVFANQSGIILESHDQGKTIHTVDSLRLAPISALLNLGDNNIMTAGYGGVIYVHLPSSGSDDKGGKK